MLSEARKTNFCFPSVYWGEFCAMRCFRVQRFRRNFLFFFTVYETWFKELDASLLISLDSKKCGKSLRL